MRAQAVHATGPAVSANRNDQAAAVIPLSGLAVEIATQARAGNSRFEIRLDPPELGRVDVKMHVDNSGTVNARLTVDRAETLDLFQRDRQALERALSQAGLDSGKTNLEFSLRQQHHNPFAGMMGASLPYLEHGVALSVVLFGLMLTIATRPLPLALGLGLIAMASALHGLAHGSETPDTGFAGYAAGFLLTTAALHIGGVGVGLAIRRLFSERRGVALGGLGAALSGAGLYLFAQL